MCCISSCRADRLRGEPWGGHGQRVPGSLWFFLKGSVFRVMFRPQAIRHPCIFSGAWKLTNKHSCPVRSASYISNVTAFTMSLQPKYHKINMAYCWTGAGPRQQEFRSPHLELGLNYRLPCPKVSWLNEKWRILPIG